jgi:hypothetical protein
MGQYYMIANLSKKEYINPSAFGNGLKLMEFLSSSFGVLSGLGVLLASSNGNGGGDLWIPQDTKWGDVPGRWAGDKIVIAGSRHDNPQSAGFNIYKKCGDSTPMEQLLDAGGELAVFKDVSDLVLGALLCDDWFRERFLDLPEKLNDNQKSYYNDQQRSIWARARPGETFPRDIIINTHANI